MNVIERYSLIRKDFDKHASQYLRNPITHWVGRSELAALRSMISPAAEPGISPALDFGCGTGRVTAMLLELGYCVTGYDLSPRMLDQARAAFGERPDVIFTSDPQALHGTWPLIVSLGVVDYYPDSTPLWKDWQRLLSAGGKLLVTAPNARSLLARVYVLASRFTCQSYATTVETLTPTAQSAGFSLSEVQFAFPSRLWGHTIVASFCDAI
jgi:SAM-dependent methyltransferase